ncbi:MAG: DUF58 domain-containing protein [Planctomycetes bacterium]|nr:DUF58 domain-containing protein [Planctomycetota bacterium]
MRHFDPEFLRRLEALRLAVRRRAAGAREGDRTSGKPGGAAVHLAHRAYVPGDDFRAVDWNLYARLEELFVREREREQAARLHVVLDASASMNQGGKLDFACRLAAALGTIAEAEGGEAVLWCGAPRRLTLDALDGISDGPAASVSARALPPRALAVAISDPWDEPVLSAPATLVHVLARDEIEPSVRGMARVVDSETRAWVDRYVGEEEVAEYKRRLGERLARWREWAHRREVGYVRCTADESLDEVIRLFLREGVLE